MVSTMRIAIIGSGISGLAVLAVAPAAEVTVYEAGVHVEDHSHDIPQQGGSTRVDTGFMLNRRNGPEFVSLV